MNKLLKTSLVSTFLFTFLLNNSETTMKIYAAHTHNDDCYEKIAHNHSDNCYEKTTIACDGTQHINITYEYELCPYCNAQLHQKSNYLYVCDKNSSHTGHSFYQTRIVKSSWENYQEEMPDGSIMINSSSYIHNCSDPRGVQKTNYMDAIAGMPGPSPCSELKETSNLICTKEYDNGNLFCNTKISSIQPKTQHQTSKNPNFTLVITYMDGHTKDVQPKMTTFTSTATYAKDSKIIAYYEVDGKLNEYVFYITTPIEKTPTPTPTKVVTQTPTPTPTKVITPTPTPTKKVTQTITPTPTKVVTPTPIKKVTQTITPTPTKVVTPTPIKEITEVPTISFTPTITSSGTNNDITTTNINDLNADSNSNFNQSDIESTLIQNNEMKNMEVMSDKIEKEQIESGTLSTFETIEDLKETKTNNKSNVYFLIGLVVGFVALITVVVIIFIKSKNSNEYVKKEDDDIYYDIYTK